MGVMAGPVGGIQYASGALNQSLNLPLQQTVNSSMDLNNSQLVVGGMNNTGGAGLVNRAAQMNSKNVNK